MSLNGYSNFWSAGYGTNYRYIANLSDCIQTGSRYNTSKAAATSAVLKVTFTAADINPD